jgi:hypothetical protein
MSSTLRAAASAVFVLLVGMMASLWGRCPYAGVRFVWKIWRANGRSADFSKSVGETMLPDDCNLGKVRDFC